MICKYIFFDPCFSLLPSAVIKVRNTLQALQNTFACSYFHADISAKADHITLVKLQPYCYHEQQAIVVLVLISPPTSLTDIINQARDKVVSQTLMNQRYYNKLKAVRKDRRKKYFNYCM